MSPEFFVSPAGGEPVYIFGDDLADYFMQLAHSPEETRKCNLVFIAEGRDLPGALVRDAAGNSLEFTAEYRMGFGLAPNSKIAQDFMEAFLAIFRAEMDRQEDPILLADQRPAAQTYVTQRLKVRRAHGGHQLRLYAAEGYTDDSVLACVGVDRTIRALKLWNRLTKEAGLRMAIPEKRSLGTWMVWLGVSFFAMLGVLAVPSSSEAVSSSLERAEASSILRSGDRW